MYIVVPREGFASQRLSSSLARSFSLWKRQGPSVESSFTKVSYLASFVAKTNKSLSVPPLYYTQSSPWPPLRWSLHDPNQKVQRVIDASPGDFYPNMVW